MSTQDLRGKALDCFSKSIEAKRDFLLVSDDIDYIYSRVKGSITEDLRKWHDIGPHLCSSKALELAASQQPGMDFSYLRNTKESRECLGIENKLQLEHVFPVRQIILLILDTSPGECLRSIIKDTSCTAWILKSEDERINEKSHRPSPMQTYQNAGIRLLEYLGDDWIDYDWTRIEKWANMT